MFIAISPVGEKKTFSTKAALMREVKISFPTLKAALDRPDGMPVWGKFVDWKFMQSGNGTKPRKTKPRSISSRVGHHRWTDEQTVQLAIATMEYRKDKENGNFATMSEAMDTMTADLNSQWGTNLSVDAMTTKFSRRNLIERLEAMREKRQFHEAEAQKYEKFEAQIKGVITKLVLEV